MLITPNNHMISAHVTHTGNAEMPVILLLAIYLVLPASFMLVVFDTLFMANTIRAWLPENPETTLWYGILFGLPHIIASMVTLMDKEYLSYYKADFMFALPVLLLLIALLIAFAPPLLLFAMITIFTMIHVIGQQVGISKMLARQRGLSFTLWKWCLLVLAVLVMFRVSTPGEYQVEHYYWLFKLFSVFIVMSLIPLVWMFLKPMPASGRWYMACTQLMVMLAVVYAETGYAFLCILVPRLVHDCSAFLFYIFHDINRNRENRQNLIYSAMNIHGRMLYWFVPLLAIGIAAVFNYVLSPPVIVTIIFFHYLMERKMWRADAPHKRQIFLK